MLSFLALSVSSAALASEPVLVPEFATASPNDFVVTTMVQNLVVNRLVSDGHIVLTSDVAGRVVSPDRLMACGPSPTCPQDVLPQVPARLAVVVTTNRTNGALTGHVELYLVGQADPAQAADVPVTPGNESLFAAEVSRLTAAMLQQIGPSPDGVLMAAAQLIAGQPVGLPAPAPMPLPVPQPVVVAPAPVPVPQPVVIPSPVANTPPAPLVDLDSPDGRSRPAPAPVPTTTRVKNGDGSTPHEGPLGPILEGTGVHERHLLGSEGSFRKSGLDPRDWMYRAMPHAGRMVIQLSSGLAMGDVERSGVFLIERTELVQSNSWYQEGPSTARRVRGDLFVGYAPATMFDFGVQVGLQYGARNIITGFVERDALGEVTSVSINQPVESQAVQFYIQPRVRGYLVHRRAVAADHPAVVGVHRGRVHPAELPGLRAVRGPGMVGRHRGGGAHPRARADAHGAPGGGPRGISAMAAELGSMRVTEQIDALDAMAVDPINYLVKPRIIASAADDAAAHRGLRLRGRLRVSYFVGIYVLHVSKPEFMVRLQDWVDWDDIWAASSRRSCSA
jgi:hypothetical protein